LFYLLRVIKGRFGFFGSPSSNIFTALMKAIPPSAESSASCIGRQSSSERWNCVIGLAMARDVKEVVGRDFEDDAINDAMLHAKRNKTTHPCVTLEAG
jgi:hypothetical protein